MPRTILMVLAMGILHLGLTLRVLWLLFAPHTIVSDEVAYHALATSLANGHGYGIPFWPPGYPLTLSALYLLFGTSPRVALLFNLVLSGFTLITAAWVAKRLFGRRVALMSLLLMALMPSYILTVALVRYEVLLQFILLLALLLSLYEWRALHIIGIALLTALATLMRPLLIFWPLLLWLLTPKAHARSNTIYKLILIQTLSVALLVPWIRYASNETGRFVPVALNAGINLWIGNNPAATGSYVAPPGEYWDPNNADMAIQEALRYIQDHPWHTLGLLPQKIFYSLRHDHWPVEWITLKTNAPIPTTFYALLTQLCDLYYAAIGGMAAISVFLLIRRKQVRQLLPLLLLLYTIAGQLPFWGSPRFRWLNQFILIYYAAILPVYLQSAWLAYGRRISVNKTAQLRLQPPVLAWQNIKASTTRREQRLRQRGYRRPH